MNQLIIEFPNSIPEVLCETIIENYELCKLNTVTELIHSSKINEPTIFEIPKNNDHWNRIEKILYKELLININKYKNSILLLNTVETIHLLKLFNNPLFTNSFLIHKFSCTNIFSSPVSENNKLCKKHNRYNVLSYIYYLNTISDGGEVKFKNGTTIIPERGKLVLFPENLNYAYKQTIPISNDQYIIYGQLCYDNII